MTEVTNVPELDLSDEDTVRRLVEADVMLRPDADPETQEIAEKLKRLQQKTTFSMKLNGNELEDITRKAAAKGMPWREYLEHEIKTLVFGAPIGRAVIDSSNFMVGGRVSAPKGLVSRG